MSRSASSFSFLDEKESASVISTWLTEEWGISSFRAKLVARLAVSALRKLLTETAVRAIERLHEALREKFGFYDDLALRLGKWLFFKIESQRASKEHLRRWIESPPADIEPRNWATINQQTKVWLAQLEKLNLIALALDDLSARVSLQTDQPKLLERAPLSRLLRPYNAFIGLIGRAAELEALTSFCERPEVFRWQVLTGDGGVGKTRLAIELAREREKAGWNAGFLSAESLKHWVRHDGFARWFPLVETLVVIDYAASRAQDLKALLERCGQWGQENSEPTTRLRLLLLERQADPQSGWLHDLRTFAAEGALRDQIQDGMEPVREIAAPGRETPDETMVAILRATFEGWSKLPGDPAPTFPTVGQQALRELRRGTQGRPLFLQMAALRACAEGDTTRLTHWGQAELLEDAVARERDYARRRLGSNATRTVLAERGAALLTFTGPLPKHHPGWVELLDEDARACGYPNAQPGEISDHIAAVLGERQDDGIPLVTPLAPDLLAEAFAVTVLAERPGLALQALEGALGLSAPDAWSNLLRATVDLHGRGKLAIAEAWLISLVRQQPLGELAPIETLLPPHSVALAPIAVALYETEEAALSETSEASQKRARVLNNLGSWYSAVGRRDEALQAMQRAVEIRERLAAQNPDAFEPALARTFGAMGAIWLADRPDKAAKASRRGIETLQRLFLQHPRTFVSLMEALTASHLSACESSGEEPDGVLLEPILKALKQHS